MTAETNFQSGDQSEPFAEGKRIPQLGKRFPSSQKRFPSSQKGADAFSAWVDETMTTYSGAGAYGNYRIRVGDGVAHVNEVFVQGAIAVRVLPGGELNLMTDAGRWFLFAPGTWKSVTPEQYLPGGECKLCGHRPNAANAAQ
jgi:hypothetical protein